MRANLQIGSEENMFVNVLEIFNNAFVQINLYQIAKFDYFNNEIENKWNE